MTVEEIYELTGIDPWFLYQIRDVVSFSDELAAFGELCARAGARSSSKTCSAGPRSTASPMCSWPISGAAPRRASPPCARSTASPRSTSWWTPAPPSSRPTPRITIPPTNGKTRPGQTDGDKVMILGGGPNRIGQGIEFDYCCCQASFALKEMGVESIMVNSNPETVSTDYDTSDKLYFEPLTREDVLNIVDHGKAPGRDRPVRRPDPSEPGGAPGQGRGAASWAPRPTAIDRAEDRKRLQADAEQAGPQAARNDTATSVEQALEIAHEISYPVLVRPSYVLGGRAMEIVSDDDGPDQLHEVGRGGLAGASHPHRQIPGGRHRSGRGRHLRRQDHRHRRHHGAHRRGRHPFRRLRLRPAALHLIPRRSRKKSRPRPGPWPRNWGSSA